MSKTISLREIDDKILDIFTGESMKDLLLQVTPLPKDIIENIIIPMLHIEDPFNVEYLYDINLIIDELDGWTEEKQREKTLDFINKVKNGVSKQFYVTIRNYKIRYKTIKLEYRLHELGYALCAPDRIYGILQYSIICPFKQREFFEEKCNVLLMYFLMKRMIVYNDLNLPLTEISSHAINAYM